MITSLMLAAAIWPANIEGACTAKEDAMMIGIARNTAGNFLYCEMIHSTGSNQIHIDYERDGKVFATKYLNYPSDLLKPNVIQNDLRSGEQRKSNVDEEKVTLQYQANKSKKVSTVDIPIANVDIVDAGFNNFVREHWNELQEGKILSVNFASIAHLKALPLRISAKPIATCATKDEQPQADSFCFFVEIDNAFLRLLLGNIKLTYDQQHRLQKFDGVVNIQDDKEATQNAIIFYYYKQDYLHQNQQ